MPATSSCTSAATPPDTGPAARAARALDRPEAAARIERLRSLLVRLEQSPRSPQRDAVLHDIRARVVALDTGLETSSAWRSKSLGRPHDPFVGFFRD